MRPLAASSVDVLRVMIAFLNSQLDEILRRVGVHALEVAGVVRLVLADPVPGVADLDEAGAVRLDPLAGGVVPEAAVLDRDDDVGRRAARSGRTAAGGAARARAAAACATAAAAATRRATRAARATATTAAGGTRDCAAPAAIARDAPRRARGSRRAARRAGHSRRAGRSRRAPLACRARAAARFRPRPPDSGSRRSARRPRPAPRKAPRLARQTTHGGARRACSGFPRPGGLIARQTLSVEPSTAPVSSMSRPPRSSSSRRPRAHSASTSASL